MNARNSGAAKKRIGIVGVGNIGASILRGLLAAAEPGAAEEGARIFLSDADKERLGFFSSSRVVVCESNAEVAEKSEVVILAVKPNDVRKVVEEISPFLSGGQKVLVSVAAGVPTSAVENWFAEAEAEAGVGVGVGVGVEAEAGVEAGVEGREGARVKVVRVMPNVGARVREAVSAVCRGKYATEEDEELAKWIFSAVGTVHTVKESELDVVTGLSGSGIAFFAEVLDAVAAGGVHEGLPYEMSLAIAAETAVGAARLVLAGEKPSAIKEMTASPGGTTVRGLYALESRAVKAAMMMAVIAATRRAREIAEQKSREIKNQNSK
ncbi:MAG: pyrroline-5-carboxylate reductase [Methanophagales archaeon]|nr:pyrroline-5-carboxylate reductase [Methanophagales archaeon]